MMDTRDMSTAYEHLEGELHRHGGRSHAHPHGGPHEHPQDHDHAFEQEVGLGRRAE